MIAMETYFKVGFEEILGFLSLFESKLKWNFCS